MKPNTSAERLESIRKTLRSVDMAGGEYMHKWSARDLLAMIDARDREIVALREVVQSLQQEGAGRVRYD